ANLAIIAILTFTDASVLFFIILVFVRWEEEKYEDGVKWKFLEHKGPYFPPEYQPLPDHVHFYYNGQLSVKLSLAAEEVALFFAQMLDHEYTTKKVFRENFFKDWRKEMTHEERSLIQDLDKCNFGEIHAMHKAKTEARKNMSKEEKKALKEANQKIVDEYGYCLLDHHKERIGNFKIEPPGLFRGRGEHPKQGMLKKRIQPEDVIINCIHMHDCSKMGKDYKLRLIPGSWLRAFPSLIPSGSIHSGLFKTAQPSSKTELKCLKSSRPTKDGSLKARTRLIIYLFILPFFQLNKHRVQHLCRCIKCYYFSLYMLMYFTCIFFQVFKSLKLFLENKQPGDELFDRLNTGVLNKHLSSLMPGLTAKVFRTYNASITLQQQLKELTNSQSRLLAALVNRVCAECVCNDNIRFIPPPVKMVCFRVFSTIFKYLHELLFNCYTVRGSDTKRLVERKKAAVKRCEEQLLKLEVQATDREENKQIALGTSKLNYLDPRISVAWCKNMEVPIEKIYNKTQREKFAWAIDMTEADFEF
uniref:DNA topoisomerase n=1 Tax=Neolamprologus brichardi TaxID=32507 RepID=A0A3Q4HZA6_NEOBR